MAVMDLIFQHSLEPLSEHEEFSVEVEEVQIKQLHQIHRVVLVAAAEVNDIMPVMVKIQPERQAQAEAAAPVVRLVIEVNQVGQELF